MQDDNKAAVKSSWFSWEREDLVQFVALSSLMFCILWNQNLLRSLKDSVLVTEVNAEVTAFVKSFLVLPLAMVFVLLYNKSVERFSYRRIYYGVISFFISNFLLFAFFLYPSAHLIHLDAAYIAELTTRYPSLKWFLCILANWSLVWFYSLAELWPDVTYAFLFWQLANTITTTERARTLYPSMSFFGNFAVFLSGRFVVELTREGCFLYPLLGLVQSKFALVQLCVSIVALVSLLSMFIVGFISGHNTSSRGLELYVAKKDDVPSMGIKGSLFYILESRYLLLMVLSTTCFYFASNLLEVFWKAKIKQLYQDVNSYTRLMAASTAWIGVLTMCMNFFGGVTKGLIDWRVIFLATPATVLLSGVVFFALSVFDVPWYVLTGGYVTISALKLAVLAGAVQGVVSKGVKYAFWDTFKEMLYIPLDKVARTRGKAAVDLIGAKFGKAISGLVPVVLLYFFHDADFVSMAPLLAVLFITACVFWLFFAIALIAEYEKVLKGEKKP